MIQLWLTVYAGFTHAFEADHLLAVSSIVSTRSKIKMAARDGIYWGLGHTSTIFITGLLMIGLKMQVHPQVFRWFEAAVGATLILLAVNRLLKLRRSKENASLPHSHASGAAHVHGHRMAYGVGLVHGLAGSGALVVLILSQIQSAAGGILYLAIFGTGSIAGMLLAAALLSVPFSKKMLGSAALRLSLVILSSLLCIVYGGKIIYENLAA